MEPLPGPGPALAPVCSLTRQPACHLPAGEHDRARPCWIRRCGALVRQNGGNRKVALRIVR